MTDAEVAAKAAALKQQMDALVQSVVAAGVAMQPAALSAAEELSKLGQAMGGWLEAWAALEGKTLRELMAAFEEDQDE